MEVLTLPVYYPLGEQALSCVIPMEVMLWLIEVGVKTHRRGHPQWLDILPELKVI